MCMWEQGCLTACLHLVMCLCVHFRAVLAQILSRSNEVRKSTTQAANCAFCAVLLPWARICEWPPRRCFAFSDCVLRLCARCRRGRDFHPTALGLPQPAHRLHQLPPHPRPALGCDHCVHCMTHTWVCPCVSPSPPPSPPPLLPSTNLLLAVEEVIFCCFCIVQFSSVKATVSAYLTPMV